MKGLLRRLGVIAFKGATAYELQVGPLWVKVVHLMGGNWHWYTVRDRFSCGWEAP